ncbi:MAG: hypothetical protein NZ529_00965 [Cytophagaceae bacterium]|nr:hypothetical protein [Cytophagaceae bacterium]MDW8455336.1 hypothetical protein [Cytophagaceae bacterium]
MNKPLLLKPFITTIIAFYSYTCWAGIFVISGIYQGKNIFIQNPSIGDGTTYCTNAVYVNDVKVMENITTGAYEIDLSMYKINDQITVKITHKDNCKPRLLNPQVIKPSSSFHFNSFQVDKDAIIWSTKGERARGKYLLEYYNNDRWILMKEIPGNGSMFLNNYNTDGVRPGPNKYRLKFVEPDGRVHYSQIVEFTK